MKDNGRILAVGAHPDDVEFRCAGTLARLQQRGYRIFIATMAPGDCGTAERAPEEIMRVRRGEAAAAAAILGAECFCLDERDLAIDYDTVTRRKVTGLLRHVDPFLVLTHPLADYMVDHEVTGRLVRDACFTAAIPNFGSSGGERHTEGIPYLYYWDPIGGTDYYGDPVPAGFLVDVSETIGVKEKMLACHESQRNWLRRQHGMDEYLDSMRRSGATRGQEMGVAYAEAFRQHRGHPYPEDNVLAKLLEA
ncbi:MAG: PIG-L family deacetylase [Armatimonadetes bacterium]|nr:PIG-L family deacetylase [Armatimonadota bacterium]